MSTIAVHESFRTHEVSLHWLWAPVWRHRRVILGNVAALTVVLAITLVMVWANQTPDVSASTRQGLQIGALVGRR